MATLCGGSPIAVSCDWGPLHWYRNVFRIVPKGKTKEVAAMLKAIHPQEDRDVALKKAQDVSVKLGAMKLG